MVDMSVTTSRKQTFMAAVKDNDGRKLCPRTKIIVQTHHKIDSWNTLKTRLVSSRMKSTSMAFVTIAGMEFRILNRLGGGDFSRVYEVLGPDKVIRAVKMVNTLADEVEDNKEEPRQVCGLMLHFRELKILRKLESVSKVTQLICYDVVYSQEGALVMIVMEKGEISLPKYLEKKERLSVSNLLYLWEGILECTAALHSKNIIHMDIKPSNFVFVRGQLKVIDLGCAEVIPDDSDRVLSCVSKGTEGYMPPECFNADTRKRFTYTVRTDSYSLGVLVIYLSSKMRDDDQKRMESFIETLKSRCLLENQFERHTADELLTSFS